MHRRFAVAASLLLAVIGLGFAAWGPLLLPWFGAPPIDWSAGDHGGIAAAFARMFGAALLCLSAAMWMAAKPDEKDRRAAFTLVGAALLVAAGVALVQQIAIWNTRAGIVLVVLLAGAGAMYLWTAVANRRSSSAV